MTSDQMVFYLLLTGRWKRTEIYDETEWMCTDGAWSYEVSDAYAYDQEVFGAITARQRVSHD